LLRSRIEATALAAYEVILFFYDDIEVEPGYLSLLLDVMDRHPNIAGAGGVDVIGRQAPMWRRLYEYGIGFRALRRGKLSFSGYGGDMDRWIGEQKAFETDFLAGFNMAFRKNALSNLEMQDYFRGVSLGEDLYLSYVARRSGPLLVHPALRVRHYQSPIARERSEQMCYTQVVNHYHLMQLRRGSRPRSLLLVITGSGLFLLFAVKAIADALTPGRRPDVGRVKGSWSGLKFVMASLIGRPSAQA
jgi:GT2 family glycosyltransferase